MIRSGLAVGGSSERHWPHSDKSSDPLAAVAVRGEEARSFRAEWFTGSAFAIDTGRGPDTAALSERLRSDESVGSVSVEDRWIVDAFDASCSPRF